MVNNKGMTMTELLVILTILSILLAIAVPIFTMTNSKMVLDSTASMIANDIRLAQNMSITREGEYQLEIDIHNNFYYVRKYDAMTAPVKYVEIDSIVWSITSTLHNPRYGLGKEGYRIIRFSPLGTPNQGGNIVLKTRSGETKTLTVDVVTGRVRIVD